VIEQVGTYRRTAVEDWALVLPFANMAEVEESESGRLWWTAMGCGRMRTSKTAAEDEAKKDDDSCP
jgi:hypothetical protein